MIAHPHDVVRVHPGVLIEGRDLGGMHLTVVRAELSTVDATETAGGRPVHLDAADCDLVFHWWGRM